MCLCVLKFSSQPGELKKGRIWLKFGTLAPWVNTWGCFFPFLKNFIFGPWEQVFAQDEARTLGQTGEPKKMVGFGC